MNDKSRKPRSRSINSAGYPDTGTYEDAYVCQHWAPTDKNVKLRTFMHYTDPQYREVLTVFGQAKPGLFYNYDDRLQGDRWREGIKRASQVTTVEIGSARFYELILRYFHDSADLDLQHVQLGCNVSTGYSYLVFGYTYTSRSGL